MESEPPVKSRFNCWVILAKSRGTRSISAWAFSRMITLRASSMASSESVANMRVYATRITG